VLRDGLVDVVGPFRSTVVDEPAVGDTDESARDALLVVDSLKPLAVEKYAAALLDLFSLVKRYAVIECVRGRALPASWF
jgi:hypothetical protein